MLPADYNALIKQINEILDQPVPQYSDQDIAAALGIPLDELPACRRAMRERTIEHLNTLARALDPQIQAGNTQAAKLMRKIEQQKYALRSATHY
jgi:hypothetical protein